MSRCTCLLLAFFLTVCPAGTLLALPAAEVISPDGSVRFALLLERPRLSYEVTFHGKPVIEASPLMMTVDGIELTEGAQSAGASEYALDETYPTRGVHSRALNRCKGARFGFQAAQGHGNKRVRLTHFGAV
jgi:alpha-glucosidase